MFLRFANFYYRFIQGFNKITVIFILIVKTFKSLDRLALIFIKINVNKVGNSGLELKSKKKTNLTKSQILAAKLKNYINNKTRFLTFKVRIIFIQLKQIFIKAPILQYFNLKYYIWIETNASSYTINRVLN